jgi:hypothetical protein
LAVVSLIALLVALAIGALISLQPWKGDSVGPRLSLAPGLGVALADAEAVAVAPDRRLAVSAARPAPAGGALMVSGGASAESGAPRAQPGIAPARAVAGPAEDPPQGSPVAPQPEPLPAPQPASAPVATPVSAPSPAPPPTRPGYGAQPGRPGSAGGPGPEGGTISGPVEIHEGDELVYSFSFYIQPSIYRAPTEDNSILRLWDEATESTSFGLQLWDDGGGPRRGLWASGDAMGGERFLAPVAEGIWHQVAFTFEASSEGDGLYLLLLDGEPIDARAWVSLIDPASGYGLLESALFRDGERVSGAPEIFFGPARLGETLGSVIP